MKILTSVSICLVLALRLGNVEDLPPRCALEKNENVLTCSRLNSIPSRNCSSSWNNITIINFCYNNFSTLKSNIFQDKGFYKLEEAILCSSNISKIEPRAFNNLTALLRLNLNGNNITKLTKYTFYGLSSLKSLRLGHNQISSLPADIFQLLTFLDYLDLSSNSLTKLPRTLLSKRPVTHLDVSENPLVFEENGPILISDSLKRLDMRSCNLKTLPVNAFSELRDLQILDLSRNELTVIQKDSLATLAKLQSLDLSNNLIFQLVDDPLSSLKALVDLNCDGNSLEVVEDCAKFLKSFAGSSGSESQPIDFDRQANNNRNNNHHGEENEASSIEPPHRSASASFAKPPYLLTVWFLAMLRIFGDFFF